MTHTQAFSEFCKALDLFDSLKAKERKAISRAASGVYPDSFKVDQAIAHDAGLDPQLSWRYTHAEAVKRIRKVVPKCDVEVLARTFVAGLNPIHCRWRAPLQAYATYCHLPNHRAEFLKEMYSPSCRVCELEAKQEWKPVYQAFSIAESGLVGYSKGESIEPFNSAICLEWYLNSQPPAPIKEDWQRLEQMLKIIDKAPPRTTGSQLAKLLKPALGTDKYDNSYVVETLGFIGLLINPHQLGDMQQWTNWQDRAFGSERNQEMLPPACGWRREFGMDADVCKQLFPKVRLPKTLVGVRASA